MATFALGELLAHPAGPFLRVLTLVEEIPRVIGALDLLAESPRPWLARLRLAAPRSPDEAEALARTLPALPRLGDVELVDIGGSYHVSFPSHVRVSRSTS